MSALSVGCLAGERTGRSKSVAEAQHGNTVEVFFSPDTRVKNSVVPKLSEMALQVLKGGVCLLSECLLQLLA